MPRYRVGVKEALRTALSALEWIRRYRSMDARVSDKKKAAPKNRLKCPHTGLYKIRLDAF